MECDLTEKVNKAELRACILATCFSLRHSNINCKSSGFIRSTNRFGRATRVYARAIHPII